MTVTDALLTFLRENNANFEVITHEPVTTSEDAARVRGTPLEQGAKALVFVADGQPILLVLPANQRVDRRAFKTAFDVKDLNMVSPDQLREMTGLEVGAVPPFGHLLGLPTYVDERLLANRRLAFNAGSRTTSVLLETSDYQRLASATIARFTGE
jgi:prolyl-tRNA editing enzyme YbaK/EbsC (Cys-tRNA(Pro) deacylase)